MLAAARSGLQKEPNVVKSAYIELRGDSAHVHLRGTVLVSVEENATRRVIMNHQTYKNVSHLPEPFTSVASEAE